VSILSVEKISHNFHDKWLFQDISFGLQKGDRIALVGINGSGKSTLLKILTGKLESQSGKVVYAKDVKIGYLEQEPSFDNINTIEDYIYTLDNEINQLLRRYEALSTLKQPNIEALQKLMDIMTAKEAWSYEDQIKSVLTRLGITDLKQPLSSLSGGQKKRLSLAKLLIDDPDVYVLDEPTNHLDIETIEWFESLLTTGNKTVLLVTHDRYFLDQVCTEIKELHQAKLYNYKGNYTYFLEKKAERENIEKSTNEKNQNLLRKELEWMRRQPQARSSKSKARIEAYYDLKEKTQVDASSDALVLDIKSARQGNKILVLNQVNKKYADNVIINDFSYTFKKGDRVGLAGKNGSGKSTFLNLITNRIQPNGGTIEIGDTTVFGYYKQEGISFNNQERVIDIVTDIAEYITLANGEQVSASQLLNLFLFPPHKQFDLVEKLSGGEKKRLQLLCVLVKNPNFLILDEPTNDLDIDTLNILEDFLIHYSGVLILVSHDRYLLDRLCDQLFIFENGHKIQIFNGNYTDYRLEAEQKKKNIKENARAIYIELPKKVNKKASYKEQKEFETLETEILHLEALIQNKTEEMNHTVDHLQLAALASEINFLNEKLEKKSDRWLSLSEII